MQTASRPMIGRRTHVRASLHRNTTTCNHCNRSKKIGRMRQHLPKRASVLIAVAAAFFAIGHVAWGNGGSTEAATAPYVQNQLLNHWRTSDSQRIETALCKPENAFYVEHDLIYSSHWNCLETDSRSRVFWMHVHVVNARDAGVTPTEYRCSSKFSNDSCPRGD